MAFVAPVFAGVAAVIGVSGTQLAIGLLATAARFALSYYQAQKAKSAADTGRRDLQQNIRQSTYPRYVVLGKARVGGVVMFYEAAGEFVYLATILSGDVIDGIDAYYINNAEVLFDDDDLITTPPFNGADGQLVKIELHRGYESQRSSRMLEAAFPDAVTEHHRARTVAYLVTRFKQPEEENFQAVYNGQIPPVAALVRGVLSYDARNRRHDPAKGATWDFSANPSVLLLYYFTSPNGMGLARGNFDGPSFNRVANFCDRPMLTAAKGYRKRYEMGGVYSLDEEPVNVIQRILDTFGGRVFVTADGLFGLSCDELDEPEIVITDDMIVEIEAKRQTGALYEYSTVKSRFSSEDHGFIENNEEADPWVNRRAKNRIGRDVPFSFDLPFVFRHDQARRLMKRKWHELNPEWTLSLVLDFNGIELFGERVCRIVYPALGIDGTFRVESVGPDAEAGLARIIVQATSIDAGALEWDAESEEGTAPAIPPQTAEDLAPATPTNLSYLVGNDGSIRALLRWNAKTNGKGLEARYRDTAGSTWTNVDLEPEDRSAILSPLTNGNTYEFQVRTTDTVQGVSGWASITFVATATAGSTGALQDLAAVGGVLVASVTAKQASAATAAYIEFTGVANGASVSWTGSKLVAAGSGETITYELKQADGARDIYARSVGINGDTGSVSGPVDVAVKDRPTDNGSGGSGGGGNDGGTTGNDGGGPIGGGNDGGSGGGGLNPGGQGGGIY
jgi:hypothetical protein